MIKKNLKDILNTRVSKMNHRTWGEQLPRLGMIIGFTTISAIIALVLDGLSKET